MFRRTQSRKSRYPKSSVPEGNPVCLSLFRSPERMYQSGSGLPLHPCPKADCLSSVPVPQKGFGSVKALNSRKITWTFSVRKLYKGGNEHGSLCCGTKLCVYSGAAQSPFGISRLKIVIPQSSTGFNQRDGEDPPQGPQGKVGPHLSPDSQQAPRLRTRHYRSERR